MHDRTATLTLAPWPKWPTSPVSPKPVTVLQHSDSEWTTLWPEIERLYVRERRKLRYVMQYMESKHEFTATEQMYKKRFARWGVQKNCKRFAPIARPLKRSRTNEEGRSVESRKASPPTEPDSMPASPKLSPYDSLALMFLTSVRTWSMAFFESKQFRGGFLVPQQQQLLAVEQQPSNTKEINFAFKLVSDLLDRDHGDLAGRMARKAFLLLENMLTLEGPVLMWNLLETMHYMVTLKNQQLFSMLLTHLIALAERQMPETHPLPTMLRGLQRLVASLTTVASDTTTFLPSSSSPLLSSSTGIDGTVTVLDPLLLSRVLSSMLERAWTLNAEILFDCLDPRLFQLYWRMVWESCSIGPPVAVIGIADRFFGQIEAQQMRGATVVFHRVERLFASTPVEEDKLVRRLLTPRMDASPPRCYEVLRASSLAALRKRWNSILGKQPSFNGDTTVLLRMLAGLATAKVLEESPAVNGRPGVAPCATPRVSRLDAGNVACTIRSLVELDTKHGGGVLGASLDAVEWIRALVALRGYAEGETYPQVVREMWLLQDALIAAGDLAEAQEVERDAFLRMENYIQDIPVGST